MGREAQVFTIFGMMTQLDEGKIFLEDEDAHIELNLEAVVKKIPHSWALDKVTHCFTILWADIWKWAIHRWRLCHCHWNLWRRSDLSRPKHWISTRRTPTFDRVSRYS